MFDYKATVRSTSRLGGCWVSDRCPLPAPSAHVFASVTAAAAAAAFARPGNVCKN